MALETFTGTHVPTLMQRARASLGADATIVAVRRNGRSFTVVASDAPVASPEPTPEPVALDFGQVMAARIPEIAVRPQPERRRGARAQRMIALVGPTGAGKTTTIAKIATSAIGFADQRVGLLGLDHYRIGAVEQLAAYAEIAGLPMATATNGNELGAAVARLSDCDVILVDTPGRSPRQVEDLATLRRWLLHLQPDEVHCVVSAGLMPQLVRQIVAQYAGFGLTHLLATKLDECPVESRVFDIAAADRRPMRWCTDGQEVPRDLHRAEQWLAAAIARYAARQLAPREVA